jgi:hypothetical protein
MKLSGRTLKNQERWNRYLGTIEAFFSGLNSRGILQRVARYFAERYKQHRGEMGGKNRMEGRSGDQLATFTEKWIRSGR